MSSSTPSAASNRPQYPMRLLEHAAQRPERRFIHALLADGQDSERGRGLAMTAVRAVGPGPRPRLCSSPSHGRVRVTPSSCLADVLARDRTPGAGPVAARAARALDNRRAWVAGCGCLTDEPARRSAARPTPTATGLPCHDDLQGPIVRRSRRLNPVSTPGWPRSAATWVEATSMFGLCTRLRVRIGDHTLVTNDAQARST